MDKVLKDQRIEADPGIRPYCFPDIQAEICPEGAAGLNSKDFRRIDFRDRGEIPALSASGAPQGNEPAGDETGAEKAVEIERQAFAQGFERGQKAGLESGKREFEPVLNNFQQALVELNRIKAEINASAEKETVELALAIARKILCSEVKTNREAVLGVVREALKMVAGQDQIKIKMSPSDLKLIRAADFKASEVSDHLGSVKFEEDESIDGGGCIIETNLGQIDARIEQQLKVVEEAFKSELSQTGLRG